MSVEAELQDRLRTLCCASQADKARGFGARVYCVGVMDFDHKQVGGLHSFSLLSLVSL